MKTTLAAGLLAVALVSQSHAALIGSTVSGYSALGLGETPRDEECKTATFSGLTVGSGPEVIVTDYTGFCNGAVDVDISDSLITLTGVREGNVGDYQWLQIELNFTGAAPILTVTALGQGLFRDDAENPAPVISWTSDSITITYDPADEGTFELADGGQAVFAINSVVEAPAPAALALFGLGLAGLSVARRSQR